jgi:hypothetical protein
MAVFYSPTTKGFYDDSLNYPSLPGDVIEINSSEHMALIDAINNQQKEIVVEAGEIVLRDKVLIVSWDDIRIKRDNLLTTSDYTQMSDWPGDKEAWAIYRQALRDIPQTYATPADVVWPTKPSA